MSINSVWYVVTPGTLVNFSMMLTLYRRQLLHVAHGLTYLHFRRLVHGNLTGVSLGFPAFRD